MYLEIKTDDQSNLRRTFDQVIAEGQQALLTIGKDGDFYVMSVNTSAGSPEAIEATHAP